MGSCSNRPDTKEEKISKFAKEVSEANRSELHWRNSYGNFQLTTGAKIRGELGVEKGNAFINTIRNATR